MQYIDTKILNNIIVSYQIMPDIYAVGYSTLITIDTH